MHIYEVRPRKDHRGVDLISDALPFGRLWYDGPKFRNEKCGYAIWQGNCQANRCSVSINGLTRSLPSLIVGLPPITALCRFRADTTGLCLRRESK